MTRRPPGESMEVETMSQLVDLGSVLLAYMEAAKHELGEVAVLNPEGKKIGTLLPPTTERAHASIRLIEGNRTIPLGRTADRDQRYDPKKFRISPEDAARIQEINASVLDARDRDRSAAALRSRVEAMAERERDPIVELREVLGDRIKGIPDVIKAFTIKDGNLERPLRTFSAAEKLDAVNTLRAKLRTPEARALMRALKKDPQEAAHWVCMLRIAKLDHGTTLTFAGLQVVLNKDMLARNQGNLADLSGDFTDEYFYKSHTLQDSFEVYQNPHEWSLVRVATVPGTNGLPLDDQERPVLDFLGRKGLSELAHKILTRTAVEAIYDYAVLIRTSSDPTKDPLFRSPVREALDIGSNEVCLVVGPFNPHAKSGVEVETEYRDELQGEVGTLISF